MMDDEEQKTNGDGGLGLVDRPTKAKDDTESDSEDEYDCQVSTPFIFSSIYLFIL